jgi:hypothetical protein
MMACEERRFYAPDDLSRVTPASIKNCAPIDGADFLPRLACPLNPGTRVVGLRPCPCATSVLSRPIEQKTIPVGLTLQDILNQKIPADEAGEDVIFGLLGGGRQSFAGFSVVALVH